MQQQQQQQTDRQNLIVAYIYRININKKQDRTILTIFHPIVHDRTDNAISSPIKHHGAYGSNGTSFKNEACAKKNPAAINGI